MGLTLGLTLAVSLTLGLILAKVRLTSFSLAQTDLRWLLPFFGDLHIHNPIHAYVRDVYLNINKRLQKAHSLPARPALSRGRQRAVHSE